MDALIEASHQYLNALKYLSTPEATQRLVDEGMLVRNPDNPDEYRMTSKCWTQLSLLLHWGMGDIHAQMTHTIEECGGNHDDQPDLSPDDVREIMEQLVQVATGIAGRTLAQRYHELPGEPSPSQIMAGEFNC